jgi:hypothetical protein
MSHKFFYPKREDPVWVSVKLGNKRIKNCALVVVEGEEHEVADDFSQNMWTKEKPDGFWNKGMLNTEKDKFKTERTGILGEIAFAKIFGLPVNIQYKKNGEPYDFILNGKKLDIKTSRSKRIHSGLVRGQNKNGEKILLLCDIYFFCILVSEDRENKHAEILLVGLTGKKDLCKGGLYPSKRKLTEHLNYEIEYKNLHKTLDLFNYMKK